MSWVKKVLEIFALLTCIILVPMNSWGRSAIRCNGGVLRMLAIVPSVTANAFGSTGIFTTLHRIGWLMATPYYRLASSPTVEVVGSIIGPKALVENPRELAEQMIDSLDDFDRMAESMGFARAESVRVVVKGRNRIVPRPILKFLTGGSYQIRGSVFNIWRRDAVMKPQYGEDRAVSNESILLHERAHQVLGNYLFNVYMNSHITRDGSLQEALADFLSAHRRGNPRIGGIPDSEIQFGRDIERGVRSAGLWEGEITVHKVMEDSQTFIGDHGRSLLMSNALWKIRERIGEQKMSRMFRPFLDNLTLYRPSFEEHIGKKTSDRHQSFIADFEYFLAVLLRTAADETDELEAVGQVVDDTVIQLGLKAERVDNLYRTLTKSDGKDLSLDLSDEAKRRIVKIFMATLHIGGAVVLAGEGVYVFALTDALLEYLLD